MRSKLIALALAFGATSAVAQQTSRVPVRVDYIADRNLYLSAGVAQGLEAGDTVRAYRPGRSEVVGRLLISSSTRSRAVAIALGDSNRIAIGDQLELELSAVAAARLATASVIEARQARAAQPELPTATPTERQRPLRVHGRSGVDFDVLLTEQAPGAIGDVRLRRVFATPVARLRATVSGLPGNLQLNTNARAQYFTQQSGEQLSLRLYQASLDGEYRYARFQLGRFYNPYESFSGYWDGALLRFGGSGAGAGVALGYAPALGNEGFSTELPKATAFIDLHARNSHLRYDGGLSLHEQSEPFIEGKRTFAGMTQLLGLGPIYLSNRLQFGRTQTDDWAMWQFQSSASVNLGRALQANLRYGAERLGLYTEQPSSSAMRTRWTAGGTLSAAGMIAFLEAGQLNSGSDAAGVMMQGSLTVPRAFFDLGLGLSGSRWTEGDISTTYIAPYIDRSFARIRLHAAGQYSRTRFIATDYTQRSLQFSMAVPLADRTEAMVTTWATRSSSSSSVRVLTSLWRSF